MSEESGTSGASTPEGAASPLDEGGASTPEGATQVSSPLDAPEGGGAFSEYEATAVKAFFPDEAGVNDDTVNMWTSVLNKGQVGEEAAKQMVASAIEHQTLSAKAVDDAWAAQKAQWLEEAKASEIGGNNWDFNMTKVKGLLSKFGSDDVRTALNESGLAYQPAMLNFLVKLASAIPASGRPAGAGTVDAPPTGNNSSRSIADRLFG